MFASLFTAIAPGQVIEGAWLSLTVTVNAQEAVWPLDAVATKVLVVTPTGNAAPLAKPVVCEVVTPPQRLVPDGAV